MDVPAEKSVCVSNPLNENEDKENEETANDETDIEEIENAKFNSKENDKRIRLAVNNAAVRNTEQLILDDTSSNDVDFDAEQ
ncbi:hypothetical protein HHI36_019826 [Cryptolaemus montrouzieri]|uniref:Uncharacterized protein n=1 Tax=Cryptolaemus montrouzieri TaxID=559131 RepID=A0ABD2N942_9CUCU